MGNDKDQANETVKIRIPWILVVVGILVTLTMSGLALAFSYGGNMGHFDALSAQVLTISSTNITEHKEIKAEIKKVDDANRDQEPRLTALEVRTNNNEKNIQATQLAIQKNQEQLIELLTKLQRRAPQ
jgi:hypothetical protein